MLQWFTNSSTLVLEVGYVLVYCLYVGLLIASINSCLQDKCKTYAISSAHGMDNTRKGANYCDECVCPSVCLSVRSHKTKRPNSTIIFCTCTLTVTVARCCLATCDTLRTSGFVDYIVFFIQEAFEKCWAHSPQRAASRQFTRCRHCTVARRLRIDVHDANDDNDNA